MSLFIGFIVTFKQSYVFVVNYKHNLFTVLVYFAMKNLTGSLSTLT